MNLETIWAIKAMLGQLNHVKGMVVLKIDDSQCKGKLYFKCELKVNQGREYLLKELEDIALRIGSLNGEGLCHEIKEEKRTLYLS
jgi:hypothetical protein